MTEEPATYDAGTPATKPIDPTDIDALLSIYCRFLPPSEIKGAWGGSLLAVARAVCPESHAVYDTRTHRAVPVEMIRAAADSLQKIASGSITGNNHAHRPWAQKRADALRSLLPTESEATPTGLCKTCGGYGTTGHSSGAVFLDYRCPDCKGSGCAHESEATTNRHNSDPQFASEDAALKALAYGSPTEVRVTIVDDLAHVWNGEAREGHIRQAAAGYGLKLTAAPLWCYLPPGSVARIDYADAEKQAASAPFYVREEGE